MGPGRLVHALGQLGESHQVGGAQVERAGGATEEERALGRQLALGVLADVTAVVHAATARRESAPRAASARASASAASPRSSGGPPTESAPLRSARAASTVRTPASNAASSVDATTLSSGRTAGASSAGSSVMSASPSAPRRTRSAAGEPSAGSTWCASSMISQCGRPVLDRTDGATTASTLVA